MMTWFENAAPPSAIFVRQHNLPGLFAGLRGGLGVTSMSDMVGAVLDDMARSFPLSP